MTLPGILLRKYSIVICFAFLFTSCNKVDVAFGDGTITDPNVAYIDTISYQLSTIRSDSFVTSQTGTLMAGRHTDPDMGEMKAESYFHLGTPGAGQVADIAVYDSAKIWVQHNGSYYGDTLLPFNFEVHTLADDIDLDGETYFYNVKSIATNVISIASLNYQLKPYLKEAIGIPVNDNFAKDLFSKLQRNIDTVGDNDHFFRYLKGISFAVGQGNRSLYAFNCADSNLYLRIYYHTSNPNPVNATVDFKYVNDNLQFNHIQINRTGTVLAAFASKARLSISSGLTANKSFIQTAGGLQLRVDFPFLRSFRTEDVHRKVLRAELYVKPYAYNPNSIYQLPATMTLRKMTDDNFADSVVTDNVNFSQQAVAPRIDNLYGEDHYYQYDITNYVNSVINGASGRYEGLTFETPAFSTNGAVDRLVLSDATLFKSIVVRIYRLTL